VHLIDNGYHLERDVGGSTIFVDQQAEGSSPFSHPKMEQRPDRRAFLIPVS